MSKDEIKKCSEMVKTAEGTYQIQMIDTRGLPSIPLSLIKDIESKRSETKVVHFYFNKNIRIKILSRQEINSREFVPIEKIINISSSQINNKN
jgi:hypothetical protein